MPRVLQLALLACLFKVSVALEVSHKQFRVEAYENAGGTDKGEHHGRLENGHTTEKAGGARLLPRQRLPGGCDLRWGGGDAQRPREYFGKVTMAQYLLDNGIDIDVAATSQDNRAWKFTALHAASYKGELAVVTLLLQRRAFVEGRNEDGRTPLADAIIKGHGDIVRLLIAASAELFDVSIPPDSKPATPVQKKGAGRFGIKIMKPMWGTFDNSKTQTPIELLFHEVPHTQFRVDAHDNAGGTDGGEHRGRLEDGQTTEQDFEKGLQIHECHILFLLLLMLNRNHGHAADVDVPTPSMEPTDSAGCIYRHPALTD